MKLHTVGHSNRSLEQLVALLHAHGIRRLVDVRRYPGSRRHPHFRRRALETSLPAAGITYDWRGEALGGHRSPQPDSPHVGWQESSFAAYADHMETEEFQRALEEVLAEGGNTPTAVMCAEAGWEHCHRRLIADQATVWGAEVVHLVDAERTEPHRLPDFARLDGERIVYDDAQVQGRLF